VHVLVQEACFPASELEAVETELRANRGRVGSYDVRVDSRVHASFCADHYAYGQELQRKYGPVLVVHRDPCNAIGW
jgi:hypothetical protein